MSDGRDAILGTIRKQLGRGPEAGASLEAIRARLAAGKSNLIPERGQLQGSAGLAMFQKMARHAKASIERVPLQEVVPALSRWFANRQLPLEIVASDEILGMDLPLAQAGFGVSQAIPRPDGAVVVTSAFAGVAETGTLVVPCAGGHPHTLNILAQQHIVLLPEDRVVANYEESWTRLKEVRGGSMPRTLLWITGPSRTGDIEQTMQLGAHGPKGLHIMLIPSES